MHQLNLPLGICMMCTFPSPATWHKWRCVRYSALLAVSFFVIFPLFSTKCRSCATIAVVPARPCRRACAAASLAKWLPHYVSIYILTLIRQYILRVLTTCSASSKTFFRIFHLTSRSNVLGLCVRRISTATSSPTGNFLTVGIVQRKPP